MSNLDESWSLMACHLYKFYWRACGSLPFILRVRPEKHRLLDHVYV
jgi:hypothetical protein